MSFGITVVLVNINNRHPPHAAHLLFRRTDDTGKGGGVKVSRLKKFVSKHWNKVTLSFCVFRDFFCTSSVCRLFLLFYLMCPGLVVFAERYRVLLLSTGLLSKFKILLSWQPYLDRLTLSQCLLYMHCHGVLEQDSYSVCCDLLVEDQYNITRGTARVEPAQ